MSEYQYYEWVKLESLLTMDEREAVDALSSHIEVGSMGASVSYNWGNFKHNPIQVLAKYFDAYLYFSNWGSFELAFGFPKGLIDVDALKAYLNGDWLSLNTIEDKLILKFEKNSDEGYCEDYDVQDDLSTLSHLRENIIQGDYRVLYIMWLSAMEEEANWYDEEELVEFYQTPEPPLPAGLSELTLPLRTFINDFEVNPFLVSAAFERSPNLVPLKKTTFTSAISKLSRKETNEFLLKIANGEAGAISALRKKLYSFDKPAYKMQAKPRTIGELIKRAEELKEIEKKRLAEEKHKRHLARMKRFEKDERKIWAGVESVLTRGAKAKVYDEATELLAQLYELAQFKGEESRFRMRIRVFAKQYERRMTLIKRWERKGWI